MTGFPSGPITGLPSGPHLGLLVVVPRIEFDAVGRAPAGVLQVPDLAGLARSACADLDVFIAQRERHLDRTVQNSGYAGGSLIQG